MVKPSESFFTQLDFMLSSRGQNGSSREPSAQWGGSTMPLAAFNEHIHSETWISLLRKYSAPLLVTGGFTYHFNNRIVI